jgi:hypothetical protein
MVAFGKEAESTFGLRAAHEQDRGIAKALPNANRAFNFRVITTYVHIDQTRLVEADHDFSELASLTSPLTTKPNKPSRVRKSQSCKGQGACA